MAIGLVRQPGQLYGAAIAAIIVVFFHFATANQRCLNIEVLAEY